MTFTVVVEDGRGGHATDTVTIEVADGEDARSRTCTFDFDSSALRAGGAAGARAGDRRAQAQPEMRLRSKATPATSARPNTTWRSASAARSAVRDYLVQRGIAADRLTTVSYGEERPAHDNAQESTRRLNRRAVLVVHATATPESQPLTLSVLSSARGRSARGPDPPLRPRPSRVR